MSAMATIGAGLTAAWAWARSNVRLVLAMLGALMAGAIAVWTYRQGAQSRELDQALGTIERDRRLREMDHDYAIHSAELDRAHPDLRDNILRRAREINAGRPGPDKPGPDGPDHT